MKIKSAISTFMYRFFAIISVMDMCLLLSIVDVTDEILPIYFLCWIGVLVAIFLAFLFYDYRIFTRHIFAFFCVVCLIHGFIHKIRTMKYVYLYNKYIDARGMCNFYHLMLRKYDELKGTTTY